MTQKYCDCIISRVNPQSNYCVDCNRYKKPLTKNNMTTKEINKLQRREEKIWEEIEPVIAGTGVASLIEELIDINIQLEALDGQ